ncbi:hypothetical protein [Geoalkalibacter halelectricus]|uniref:OmpA family protein n=1 Tax=Geoalkalibacter halelectricus TaxID=2847045 RepID=A0ABY5ZN17_9BACT|nr:hypothetical protein [Geoalkalibacter halelectricus]MDO3379938.1 hypothetical protein [Geoalkalibacter halelectricus]UWZ80535.1 hypothetical protein L9S41_03830 [Geoalkalibacter halelectricus]
MKFILTALYVMLFYVLAWAEAPMSAQQPATHDLLAGRKVLGTVDFLPGADDLSAQGLTQLAGLMPGLRDLDYDRLLVRIEGFSSSGGGGGDAVTLAMVRAQSVGEAIKERLPKFSLILTGFAAKSDRNDTLSPDRVEIVLYDNLMDIGTAGMEEVITR